MTDYQPLDLRALCNADHRRLGDAGQFSEAFFYGNDAAAAFDVLCLNLHCIAHDSDTSIGLRMPYYACPVMA